MPAARTLRARLARLAIRGATVTTLHQAIAFDALGRLATADAPLWEQLFLAHARTLALGAAAPDVDFRDFRNHLLFPNDDMWGGAAAKATCWHRNLVSALANAEWENASYCAGVLSHYVIDALHPFHTAQSQADNDVYAALAYCTHVNYHDLVSVGREFAPRPAGCEDASPAALVVAGAMNANRQYGALLAHTDLLRATSDPKNGIDHQVRSLLAGFIHDATHLVATLFASAIEQAKARPPERAASYAGARAVAALPLTALTRWRHRRSLQLVAERAVSEFTATGRVTHAAPPKVRVKRELYAREVLSRQAAVSASNVVALQRKADVPRSANTAAAAAQVVRFRPANRQQPPSVALQQRRRSYD